MEPTGQPLSVDFRSYLRFFAFYLYNGSLDPVFFVKEYPGYRVALETRGDLFGRIFAVFLNNLEVTLDGKLISNSSAVHRAQVRAAHTLIKHLDPDYEIAPPLSESELQIEGSQEEWRDAVKRFARDFGLGILEPSVLGEFDYLPQSWDYESIFAVFSNVLRITPDGKPTNARWARHRAAQYTRMYVDRNYVVAPPFEGWEIELHL
jgi:hypothetical protein